MVTRAPSREQRGVRRFSLSSAFSEWLLIALLFLDAFLSYLAKKLARFCELQAPCLLCSRFEHIMGSERPGLYRDLLCNSHQLEISSLAYCHFHEICENCLLSFTKEIEEAETIHQKSDSKLDDMAVVPLLNHDAEPGSICIKHCSFCSEPFGLLQRRAMEGLSNRRENSLRSPPIFAKNHGVDLLSHVGYSKVKVTSDSESEVPFSDEDDGNALVRIIAKSSPKGPSIAYTNDMNLVIQEKLIQNDPVVLEPSVIVPEIELRVDETPLGSSSTKTIAIGHGLEEINWSQIEMRVNHPATPESVSEQTPAGNPNENLDVSDNGYPQQIPTAKNAEVSKISNPSVLSPVDLNDAFKLAFSSKISSPPPTSIDVAMGKESTKAHEDLRMLLSQITAARGLEFPWNEMMSPSPRIHSQLSDASSISKRFSLETNESGTESLYGVVSEVEGENAVDHLKRQVELDRKSMTVLFKELEEERSASAIAANQAMAMINRLQEEKAAMQMEALQYQRMMEEQAEYDQEALEKLNDLLSEREKDIQDLEAEVESYRKRFEPSGDSVEREASRVSTPRALRSVIRNKSDRSLESGWVGSRLMKDTLLDIDDEKAYISECLLRLKKKLHQFTENPNGVNLQSSEDPPEDNNNEAETNGDGSSSIESSNGSRESQKERRLCSVSSNSIQYPVVCKGTDAASIGDEVLQMTERLDALESDRDFLDRAINSLKNENEGVQFIREIACHLRELRRIGIRLRKHLVS